MGSKLAHVRRLRRFIEEARQFFCVRAPHHTEPVMAELQIIPKTTGELKPYPRNARTHSPKQIAEIAPASSRSGSTIRS